MKRYNLVDEKWIPVRLLDGSYDSFGIAETFLRAKEIAIIEDQSPLVVASLYRFLLAILYRALKGPTDIDQAKILFKEGLSFEKIESYLELWKERFWLFDEKYPFGQIPTFEPEIWKTWTTLTAEHNAANAKILFDHINVQNPDKITEAKAICGILAIQTFALSSGKSELAHTGTAPSATAMMVVPIGINLEDTLIFSLVVENRVSIQGDLPLWEREPESVSSLKSGTERTIDGFSDLYSWRSRSIRLQKNLNDVVEKVAFASGVKHKTADIVDPMLAYRIDDKLGRLPIQLRDRGLWRSFDCLLPDSSGLAPKVIEHAILLSRSDPKRFPQSVMILGQSNNKAKIEFWRMERIALPKALITERSIRADIHRLLNIAEENQKILWGTCEVFSKNVLSHGARKVEKNDISAFIKQMECISLYWSTLEAKFHSILSLFTLDSDMDEIEYEWLLAIESAVINSWNHQKASYSSSNVWSIRAKVKAEGFLLSKLSKIQKTIKEHECQEVK